MSDVDRRLMRNYKLSARTVAYAPKYTDRDIGRFGVDKDRAMTAVQRRMGDLASQYARGSNADRNVDRLDRLYERMSRRWRR